MEPLWLSFAFVSGCINRDVINDSNREGDAIVTRQPRRANS
jgi:hypothetical protein